MVSYLRWKFSSRHSVWIIKIWFIWDKVCQRFMSKNEKLITKRMLVLTTACQLLLYNIIYIFNAQEASWRYDTVEDIVNGYLLFAAVSLY